MGSPTGNAGLASRASASHFRCAVVLSLSATCLSGCYTLPAKAEFAYPTAAEKNDATVTDDTAPADVAVGEDSEDTATEDAAMDAVSDAAVFTDADAAAPDSADADDAQTIDATDVADTQIGPAVAFRSRFVAVAWQRQSGKTWGVGGASFVAGSASDATYKVVTGWLGWLLKFVP